MVFVSACHSQSVGEAFVAIGVKHVVAIDKRSPVLDTASRVSSSRLSQFSPRTTVARARPRGELARKRLTCCVSCSTIGLCGHAVSGGAQRAQGQRSVRHGEAQRSGETSLVRSAPALQLQNAPYAFRVPQADNGTGESSKFLLLPEGHERHQHPAFPPQSKLAPVGGVPQLRDESRPMPPGSCKLPTANFVGRVHEVMTAASCLLLGLHQTAP